MKAKTIFSKRFLFIIFLIGFLFANTYSSYGQSSICEPCPQLAEYIDSPNKANSFIQKAGYSPPPHIKKEWKKFPAIRKIEMAYEAFENCGNGENFLSKLSNSIKKENGAISYETKLKDLIDKNVEGVLDYAHSTKYQKTNLSKPIRRQIMTISKYTEAGAFGGIRGVLQYKLGLPEDEVYKILRESTSFTNAFENGLNKAKMPPSQQERIKNLIKDLMKKNPSATYDKNLIQFLEKQKKVDNYLSILCENSRWEKIRRDFHKRINIDNLGFNNNQIEIFKTVLDDWDNYKNKNKFKWFNTNINNLEEQFYNYSKSSGKIKACWGFILQQQGWDGAVHYYTEIAPNPSARGNPYYLLNYYYNSTSKEGKIERLYDKVTDFWVGRLCQPH